ncbi:Glutamine--fructose-6-phosphate aminotransferase [isomerizing] [Posidoniimonas polymericola]|uniref:Glutamine--fructose-6-phosphate aminotransferase [isomerizing] n=1 Tax=Posidoniimonas polymericola TaxID=2528002 RepID=A0A5C5YH00_9BACT|nr:glutamine--fructose-6-phosphate transaminase (isomerizing) [Posidoniimonas polymericola]TWT73775.1 Glutamine--fructose-6-phosphate aminotransferase [isomerizing] [Posidoniimonas polymericola]
MCGIVGYIGPKQAAGYLMEGLRRLEYRGYDSSGIVTLEDTGEVAITKAAGRIDQLAAKLRDASHQGGVGLGHTRWATHGAANDTNSHPHLGGQGEVALVHNGVIENFRNLRDQLEQMGYEFISETDSEVVAHLIAAELKAVLESLGDDTTHDPYAPLVEAVRAATSQLRGTYGLGVVFRDYPEVVLAARLGSPLVIGVGSGENFIASDGSPLVGHTDRITYLSDHEIAVVTADSIRLHDREQGPISHKVSLLEIDESQVSLNGFPHYMLKEIFEQPETIRAAMRGRLDEDEATAKFGGLNLTPRQLQRVDRLVLTACGTSWHSALLGEYMLEAFARIPVEVEYASELRYRNPPLSTNSLLFAITQSGETIDTLAALREIKRKGHPTLAICNVVGSTIAREADGGVYLHAGPEIGVASTKAYTSQCTVLALLALYIGRLNHLSFEAGLRIIEELKALPDQVEKALDTNNEARRIAAKYAGCNNFLYLGRQFNFPTALEGALKLKEISYIHAEGYPAAEMKHGPIALVDENTPSVFIVPQGGVYHKVISNMEEIKARGGPLIAVVDDPSGRAAELADDVICVPSVSEFLQPIVAAVPLQLLAYHIAVHRGCDVDKPRNLAKSVTVE